MDRALRRAGVERPVWQPMELFFEDLDLAAERGAIELGAASPANDRAASLVEDGVTVAHAVDAALFDPIAISDERSRAAYKAALRLQTGFATLESTVRCEGR